MAHLLELGHRLLRQLLLLPARRRGGRGRGLPGGPGGGGGGFATDDTQSLGRVAEHEEGGGQHPSDRVRCVRLVAVGEGGDLGLYVFINDLLERIICQLLLIFIN